MKTLPAGRDADRLRLRRPHRRRPPDGRREGQRPDRPAPLPAQERRLRRDPDLEVGPRPVARLDERSPRRRAPATRSASGSQRETRERDRGEGPRDRSTQALKAQNLPYRKLAGSAVLAQVIRETGFKKAEDFYLALGSGKLPVRPDRQQGAPAAEDGGGRRGGGRPAEAAEGALDGRRRQPRDQGAGDRRRARPAREVLHAGAGRRDRRLHLARQGDHDPPRGLPEREGADAQPRAVHAGRVGGRRRRRRASASRSPSTRGTARACSRTSRARFAEHGANIVSYGGVVEDQMAQNWYTAEVGDVKELRALLNALAEPRRRLRRLPRHAELTDRLGGAGRSCSGSPKPRPGSRSPDRAEAGRAPKPGPPRPRRAGNSPLTISVVRCFSPRRSRHAAPW